MPAKYPKLKRAVANSGMKAQRTIVTATACQKAGFPGVLPWSTTVIDKQVMTTRMASSETCHPSMAARLNCGVFIVVAASIERDIGRQRCHDQEQRQHELGADVLRRVGLLVIDHPPGTDEANGRD